METVHNRMQVFWKEFICIYVESKKNMSVFFCTIIFVEKDRLTVGNTDYDDVDLAANRSMMDEVDSILENSIVYLSMCLQMELEQVHVRLHLSSYEAFVRHK